MTYQRDMLGIIQPSYSLPHPLRKDKRTTSMALFVLSWLLIAPLAEADNPFDVKHGVVSHVIFDRFIIQGGRLLSFLAVQGPAGNVRNVVIKNAPLYSPLATGGSSKGLSLFWGDAPFPRHQLGSQDIAETVWVRNGEFVGEFIAHSK